MRNTDLECKRCGFKGELPGKPDADTKCPQCGAGEKSAEVQSFEGAVDQAKSQLTFHAILSGWAYTQLEWKKYPCSEGGRVDLVCEGVRLATIRVMFDPPSVKHRWVGPARGPEPEVRGPYDQPVTLSLEHGHEPHVETERAWSLGAESPEVAPS